MFFFGPNDRTDVDDFRSAVHDSDGLALWNGQGERTLAPADQSATNCRSASSATSIRAASGSCSASAISTIIDDLEARYEQRPSLWIEPIGDWGEGAVYLVEIPTKEEIHDNIVAFWRPDGIRSRPGNGVPLQLPHALGWTRIRSTVRASCPPTDTRIGRRGETTACS